MRHTRLLPILLVLPALVACGDGGAESSPDARPDGPDAGAVDAAHPPADAISPPDGGIVDPFPALEREHAGGMPSVVELRGDRVYVGVGPRLAIWSVANPAAPSLLGESAPLPGLVGGVAVVGARAFVTSWTPSDGRLHVLDIGDPSQPIETASVRIGSGATARPLRLIASGTRLFLADYYQGLFELDITDADAPAIVTLLPGMSLLELQLVDGRLYGRSMSFAASFLREFSIDGELTVLGGSYVLGTLNLAVAPGPLLVTSNSGGVHVLDLSNPNAPVELYTLPLAASDAVVAAGTTAYVRAGDGMHVFDLSNPQAIQHLGPLVRPPHRVVASSITSTRLAQVTDAGALILEARVNPQAPIQLSTTTISESARGMALAVDRGTVVVGQALQGSRAAVSMLGLGKLSPGGSMTLGSPSAPSDVALADGIAYVADGSAGVHVIDVRGAVPSLATTLAAPARASTVAVTDARLYVGDASEQGGLYVFDRSNPLEPTLLATVPAGRVRDVAVSEPYVLVADEGFSGFGGMRVYSFADSPAGQELARYTLCAGANSVAISGTIAVLGCASSGFHVIDLADPNVPVQLAVWSQSSVRSVEVAGDLAYLGHSRGVTVIDLADPSAPVLVRELFTAWDAMRIVTPFPGRVVAVAGQAGVYQWEL